MNEQSKTYFLVPTVTLYRLGHLGTLLQAYNLGLDRQAEHKSRAYSPCTDGLGSSAVGFLLPNTKRT